MTETLARLHQTRRLRGIADRLGGSVMRSVAPLSSRWFGGRGCCLTFHRVVRTQDWDGLPNRDFYVDVAFLERLIGHLVATGWDIVTMSEALRRIGDPSARPFVNFSVDDCYADTADLLIPLFRRLGQKLTLFVTTGIPDRTLRLPFAGLETILQSLPSVVDASITYTLSSDLDRRQAFAAISARWDGLDDIEDVYAAFCTRYGFDVDVLDDQHRMTWPMLEAARDEPVVEIGGHTIRHRRISALGPEEAWGELVGCRSRLQQMLDISVEHFAFPYGRSGDCGPRDFALVRDAGFASAATTRKGLCGPASDPFRLPRNTLNGSHRRIGQVYAHLSGASGLATRIMRRG